MEKSGTPIGSYAPDFELPGIDEQVHHLSRYLDKYRAVAVVFMCNECSHVALYIDRLKQIQAKFENQDFTLIGINASDADQYPEESFENMKAFAQDHQLNFPYLRDTTQDVALSFGAQKTPEVFLLDKTGILRYSGEIDDNAQEPDLVQTRYLWDATQALLTGETRTIASTEAVGDAIKWRR